MGGKGTRDGLQSSGIYLAFGLPRQSFVRVQQVEMNLTHVYLMALCGAVVHVACTAMAREMPRLAILQAETGRNAYVSDPAMTVIDDLICRCVCFAIAISETVEDSRFSNQADFQFRNMAVALRSHSDLVYLPDHGFVGEDGGELRSRPTSTAHPLLSHLVRGPYASRVRAPFVHTIASLPCFALVSSTPSAARSRVCVISSS